MASSAAKINVPEPLADDRVVGRFEADPQGPTLIVIGSLHGNEPGGRAAMEKAAEFLRVSGLPWEGRVYLITGNVRALRTGVRYIGSDLNRHWTRENVLRNVGQNAKRLISEDLEQRELLEVLRPILQTARAEVYVLDLHSTSAGGRPFATVGDTMRNRRFAMRFPVTILLGIEEQLEGTLLEFLNNEGAVTLGFEGGQHSAATTVANHLALIYCALVNSGLVGRSDLASYDRHFRTLRNATGQRGVFEVRYRHPVAPGDGFSMKPGFGNFDPIRKGTVIAEDRQGKIRARESGTMLMPLYQKLGEDGFFIAKNISPFWLRVSAVLRKYGAARLVRFLPGVTPYPKRPEQLQINTRIARFFPLQIFHLLGFRRLRWKRHFLVVSRRRFDTESPFERSGN